MKPTLFALGALALGASALYYLDPKRARAGAGRSARTDRWSPSSFAGRDPSLSRHDEPGEIEEIAGSPSGSTASQSTRSDFAPGTSGISTPGAPTSGTGAFGLGASGTGGSTGTGSTGAGSSGSQSGVGGAVPPTYDR
jgi:hypothetical protein